MFGRLCWTEAGRICTQGLRLVRPFARQHGLTRNRRVRARYISTGLFRSTPANPADSASSASAFHFVGLKAYGIGQAKFKGPPSVPRTARVKGFIPTGGTTRKLSLPSLKVTIR
jgi:hypothetical protein